MPEGSEASLAITLSRRQALAAGVAAAHAPWFADSACAAEPRRLVGVIEEDPPLINPAVTTVISSYVAGCPVYSALTRMDINGAVTGDLAQSWEISPDGKTYAFRLHPNVLWHDGTPFSSEDVKFSFLNVNSKFHPYRGALAAIASIETGENLVIFHLRHPQGSLLNAIHNLTGCILPRHIWEGGDVLRNPHNKAPIGTGPFKLVDYLVGDRIRYVKNEKYFIPGQPAFDEIVLRIIPDPAARVAALERADVDMLYSSAVPAPEVQRIGGMPGITLKLAEVSAGGYIGNINTRRPYYSDVRVRRALAHAIDRAYIRSNVLPGLSRNLVGPLPPSSPLLNTKLQDYAFNPQLANEMLDQAGYQRGADGTRFEFRLLWSSNDLRVTKMADVIAQNLAAIGLKAVLQPLERSALNQVGYIKGDFDMIIDSFALGPDPDITVERLYNSKFILASPFVNNSGYSNPAVDALFDEQRVQTDPAKRKELYDRIQELIWADIPILPLCAYAVPSAIRSSYAAGVFDSEHSMREDFGRATPVAQQAAPHAATANGWSKPFALGAAAAAAAVGIAGALWLKRRANAREDGDA